MASSQLHVTKPGPVNLQSKNEKHVTPPFFIFMSQQSVSEVPSPLATQAPPLCLCSTAQHMKAICVKTLNFHPYTPPAIYMLFDDWLRDELEQQRRRWSRKRFITPVYSGIAALICATKQLCHTLILIMVFLIIGC